MGRRIAATLIASLTILGLCSTVSAADGDADGEEVTAATPGESDEVAADEPDPLDSICGDRKPCVEMRQFDGGEVDGAELTVFEIALHDRGDEGRREDMSNCAPFEYWVVESEEGRVVDQTKLFRICNDGYGARMMGEDHVAVEDNVLVHRQTGGSSWMWTTTSTYQLSPAEQIGDDLHQEWSLGVNYRDLKWDWTEPGGGAIWSAPLCSEEQDSDGFDRYGDAPSYRYERIMQVDLGDEFRDERWKTTELGECSLRVDSRGNDDDEFGRGFVIHGEPGDPEEATFRVVTTSPTELFIEIRDREWIGGADSWIDDDHIEIWTGDRVRYTSECIEPVEASQWGISVFTGQVYSGHNEPDPEEIRVERHEVRRGDEFPAVRFKIEFATAPEAFSVVYSDSDNGEGQKRMIATSDVEFGEAASLGDTFTIQPNDGRCEVVDGRLEFEALQDR